MTIKEFYEWAQSIGATDAEIKLQCQDGNGTYELPMSEIDVEVDDNIKPISVTLS